MRQILQVGQKFSVLGFGGGGDGGFVFKDVNVSADFPTLAEANENKRTIYVGGTDPSVTDNDPTKTNTGFVLNFESVAIWNSVTSSYVGLGNKAIWATDSVGDRVYLVVPRNIDLQTKGFRDADVVIPIKLGDSSNTSFNTTNKTIVGAVNELHATSSVLEPENLTSQLTASPKTTFTLSQSTSSPIQSFLNYNTNILIYGVDYTISGNTLTYIGTDFDLISDSGKNKLFIHYAIPYTPVEVPKTSFRAQISAGQSKLDITGDGTTYPIVYDNDSSPSGIFFNVNNRYNNTTGQYTAEQEELFICSTTNRIGGFNINHEVITNFLHRNSSGTVLSTHIISAEKPFVRKDLVNQVSVGDTAQFRLQAGDTVEVAITGQETLTPTGAKTIDVLDVVSEFSGYVAKIY